MTNANDARRIVLQSLSSVSPEQCELQSALGRFLAKDVIAPHPVPRFDNSGMDGYAVRTADLAGGKKSILSLQGEASAGKMFEGSLHAGHAIRITTGSPIPAGADAVVEQELVAQKNGSVEVEAPIKEGRNIRRQGEDVRAGSVVLTEGTKLDPAALGVLASLGIQEILVYKKIRVAVLTTGDEVVDFREEPAPGQIRNSNAISLEAMLRQDGFDVTMLGIARDNPDDLRRRMAEGLSADALITSGGISVGPHDYMLKVLESLKVDLRFWKVNIKPGMPMAFGISEKGSPVFSLPGNPVSTLVTYLEFVRPGLERMSGAGNPETVKTIPAVLEENLNKTDSKRHFVRGIFESRDGRLTVRTTGSQSSGVLTSLVQANCLIVIPEDIRNPKAGDMVEVELL